MSRNIVKVLITIIKITYIFTIRVYLLRCEEFFPLIFYDKGKGVKYSCYYTQEALPLPIKLND